MSAIIATLGTAVVGVVGIVSTFVTAKQARELSFRLSKTERQRADRQLQIDFFSELIVLARRLQRASVEWTIRPSAAAALSFDEALDDFGLSVAQARLTQPASVHTPVVDFENAFRAHRRDANPRMRPSDDRFKLAPLIDAMKEAVGPEP